MWNSDRRRARRVTSGRWVLSLKVACPSSSSLTYAPADFHQGTHMYQSYKVLSEPHPDVRPHDFMDDLESFFYVWCHVTFLYDGGRSIQPTFNHPVLHDWNSRRRHAANAKRLFLFNHRLPRGTPLHGLDADTRVVIIKLIDSLRAVFLPTINSYDDAVDNHYDG